MYMWNKVRNFLMGALNEKSSKKEEHCNSSGCWDALPAEMKDKVFGYVEASDLRNFALASKTSYQVVFSYIQSAQGVKRLHSDLNEIRKTSRTRACSAHARPSFAQDLGMLLKVCTALLPVDERIQIIHGVIMKLEWTWKTNSNNPSDERWYLYFFGMFGQTLTAGWGRNDLLSAHRFLEKASGIESIVNDVLSSSPGTHTVKERNVREYYQYMYLNAPAKSVCRFWLSTILENLPKTDQAKLLYIIYGPTSGLSIDWFSPQQNIFGYLPYELSQLAAATSLLSEDEEMDDILELVSEIICLPFVWHPLNVAHYVMACGDNILTAFMSKYLETGQYFRLGLFVLHCGSVLMRHAKDMKKLLNVLRRASESAAPRAVNSNGFLIYLPVFLRAVYRNAYTNQAYGMEPSGVRRVVTELLIISSSASIKKNTRFYREE